jgi:DNA-binding MarR family transcriptional regulator
VISDARFSVRLAALVRKVRSEGSSVAAQRRRIALYALATEGDMTTGELRERFDCHDTIAAHLMRNLVEEGLVAGYRRPPSLFRIWTLTDYGMEVALSLLDKEEDV